MYTFSLERVMKESIHREKYCTPSAQRNSDSDNSTWKYIIADCLTTNRWMAGGNMYILHRHMNVEIGTEAVLFPEKEYILGIFFAVRREHIPKMQNNIGRKSTLRVLRQPRSIYGGGAGCRTVPHRAALGPSLGSAQLP